MSGMPDRPQDTVVIDRILSVIELESRFHALSPVAKRTAVQTLVLTLEERIRHEAPEQPAAEPSSA